MHINCQLLSNNIIDGMILTLKLLSFHFRIAKSKFELKNFAFVCEITWLIEHENYITEL